MASLLASACGGERAPAPPVPAPEAATPAEVEAPARAELEAEIDALRAELAAEREKRLALAEELGNERDLRFERELAWLDYTHAVADIDVEQLIEAAFAPHLPEISGEVPAEPEPVPTPQEIARRVRAETMAVSLKSLMRIEEVRGIDLLELGQLGYADAGHGTVGPVVFRLLDARGRLSGSLFAASLRLEGSRAAHTLTLVLEDGYESRGGQRYPFVDGVRRLVLPHVDPAPWMETLPELFVLEDLREAGDDGLWDLARVRRELNDKLREDASGGFYHLHRFEGVRDGEFVDVQLSGFDERGRLERRLFADRMHIVPQDRGLQLVLEDGAIMRGDETTPFPSGVFRIFLPTASQAAWRAARLPGLVEPPALTEAALLQTPGEGPGEEPGGETTSAGEVAPAPKAADPRG